MCTAILLLIVFYVEPDSVPKSAQIFICSGGIREKPYNSNMKIDNLFCLVSQREYHSFLLPNVINLRRSFIFLPKILPTNEIWTVDVNITCIIHDKEYWVLQLPKCNNIRLGNWEADVLSEEQILYAATDAFVSWYLYQVIEVLPELGNNKSEEPVAVTGE